MNKNYEFFIVGDFEVNGKTMECMIVICGRNEEHANKVLADTIANPPKNCLGNIHIAKEEVNACWWND